jgi:hypothetical protein
MIALRGAREMAAPSDNRFGFAPDNDATILDIASTRACAIGYATRLSVKDAAGRSG